jgi:hypothetical protein
VFTAFGLILAGVSLGFLRLRRTGPEASAVMNGRLKGDDRRCGS